MASEVPSATFVVRAWWENGAFRARITYVVDSCAPRTEQTRVVVAQLDEVQDHLRSWLTAAAALHDPGSV